MIYKDALTAEMGKLSQNPKVRFIGYNLAYGSKYYGTLANVPRDQIIETPVAENLMCGIAVGLALEGFLPVLCFERMDFTLAAADALINHIGALQEYGMVLPIIIRACIGTDTPLDPGSQHKQDYSILFRKCSNIIIYKFSELDYSYPQTIEEPVMIIERKDLYEYDCAT